MNTQEGVFNCADVLHCIFLAPVLLAALIGASPLVIPCITCRCCKWVMGRFKGNMHQC